MTRSTKRLSWTNDFINRAKKIDSPKCLYKFWNLIKIFPKLLLHEIFTKDVSKLEFFNQSISLVASNISLKLIRNWLKYVQDNLHIRGLSQCSPYLFVFNKKLSDLTQSLSSHLFECMFWNERNWTKNFYKQTKWPSSNSSLRNKL